MLDISPISDIRRNIWILYYENCRRKWSGCIWGNYVCKFYFCGYLYRVFHRKRARSEERRVGNTGELKNLFKRSLKLIGVFGIILTALAELLASPLTKLFVGYDRELFLLTCHGFRIYAIAFFINGFNIFGSAFFTALSNGVISAVISFLRTLLFQVSAVLLLPVFLGKDGIWLAIVAAEVMALVVTTVFWIREKERYHYM